MAASYCDYKARWVRRDDGVDTGTPATETWVQFYSGEYLLEDVGEPPVPTEVYHRVKVLEEREYWYDADLPDDKLWRLLDGDLKLVGEKYGLTPIQEQKRKVKGEDSEVGVEVMVREKGRGEG